MTAIMATFLHGSPVVLSRAVRRRHCVGGGRPEHHPRTEGQAQRGRQGQRQGHKYKLCKEVPTQSFVEDHKEQGPRGT